MNFPEFLSRARAKEPKFKVPHLLVAMDPGETTGYAIFLQGALYAAAQLPTPSIPEAVDILQHLKYFSTLDPQQNEGQLDKPSLFDPPVKSRGKPDVLVYENYRVYGWKTQDHAFAELHTPKLIGAIACLSYLFNIPSYDQMAQQPKMFCTDKKLREWGYYQKAFKHANDAIRHGCYYLLFNHMKSGKAKTPKVVDADPNGDAYDITEGFSPLESDSE